MSSFHLFLISSASTIYLPFLSFIVPIFGWNAPFMFPVFLRRSLVFPLLLSSSIIKHCLLKKAALYLLVILWNSEFNWVYLSLFPLLFASFHSSALCKASSDNHFAFSLFFNLWDGFVHCLLYNITDLTDGQEFACNAGDLGSILGSGRSPGEGNGNPLQYSCLENNMDRRAWWAKVHGVAKSWTQLSGFHFTSLLTKSSPLNLLVTSTVNSYGIWFKSYLAGLLFFLVFFS